MKLLDVIPFIVNEEITDGVKEGFCCYIHTFVLVEDSFIDFLFLVLSFQNYNRSL